MKILVSCSLSQFDLFGQKMVKNVRHGFQKPKITCSECLFPVKNSKKIYNYKIIYIYIYKKDAHHDLDNLNSCSLALKRLIDRSMERKLITNYFDNQ